MLAAAPHHLPRHHLLLSLMLGAFRLRPLLRWPMSALSLLRLRHLRARLPRPPHPRRSRCRLRLPPLGRRPRANPCVTLSPRRPRLRRLLLTLGANHLLPRRLPLLSRWRRRCQALVFSRRRRRRHRRLRRLRHRVRNILLLRPWRPFIGSISRRRRRIATTTPGHTMCMCQSSRRALFLTSRRRNARI